MNSSLQNRYDWTRYTIYIPAFLIACFCFIWHVALTHLDYVPKIPEPIADYQVEHLICQEDCQVIKDIGCREWSRPSKPKLCEFVCDSYLKVDSIRYSKEYSKIFSCVLDAETSLDIEACGLNCTNMDML